MFEMQRFEELTSAADAVGVQTVELATTDQLAEAMKSVRGVVDRLEGLEAILLQTFEQVDGPAEQGGVNGGLGAPVSCGWMPDRLARGCGRGARCASFPRSRKHPEPGRSVSITSRSSPQGSPKQVWRR